MAVRPTNVYGRQNRLRDMAGRPVNLLKASARAPSAPAERLGGRRKEEALYCLELVPALTGSIGHVSVVPLTHASLVCVIVTGYPEEASTIANPILQRSTATRR